MVGTGSQDGILRIGFEADQVFKMSDPLSDDALELSSVGNLDPSATGIHRQGWK